MRRVPRLFGVVVIGAALASPGCAATSTGVSAPVRTTPALVQQAPASTTIAVGRSVWVSVSVATLWSSPSAPRAVDAKALGSPVDIRGWLAAMSTSVRLGLVGRVETQSLYGERLVVTAVRSGWLHVVAPNQPTRKDRRGYPAWVPTRQVTTHAPTATASVATVTAMTTWLRRTTGARALEVSVGTRLPVVATSSTGVTVVTPTGARLVVAPAAVVVRRASDPPLARTAASTLASARTFIGRPYLWGGRSGFAVDCSGLTQLAYALHGVVIPRDTGDQALAGTSARLTSLRAGDLLLFGSAGSFTHVGIYAGNATMVHAPRTGTFVQVSSIGKPAIARRLIS